MKNLLLIGALFCSAPAIAQDQCTDSPDAGVCEEPSSPIRPRDIPLPVQRQLFMMGAAAAIVDHELELKKKDPFYKVMPVDAGLAVNDGKVGVFESPLCDSDQDLIQVMARAFSSVEGAVAMHNLGFTAIWCKGEKHGYRVYPAREVKPKTEPQKKTQKKQPDGSI